MDYLLINVLCKDLQYFKVSNYLENFLASEKYALLVSYTKNINILPSCSNIQPRV